MAGIEEERAVTEHVAVRRWFNEHGWQLQPADLRSALRERSCDDDLIVDLIDEGADRRRAAEAARPRAPEQVPDPSGGPVPPQNLEAEESVLGGIMLSQTALEQCRRILGDDGAAFYRQTHATIWKAALTLHDRAAGSVDAITLADALDREGQIDQVGGRIRIHELAAHAIVPGQAVHYAGIVRETAILRGAIRYGGETARLGFERAGSVDDLITRLEEGLDELKRQAATGRERIRITPAQDFLATKPATVGVLLGTATDKVLPEHGLAIVYGKGAAGKTTLTLTAVASLASATPWLTIPVPRPVRILLIENEGPKAPYTEKLAQYASQWDGPAFLPNVVVYEEPWGKFSLADRGMRDDLLQFAREHRIDLVCAGPLRGLGMAGPGAPSETDAFLDLLKDAGLGTELAWWIVHHVNKAGQISGDFDRHPDTLIRYTYEGKRRNQLTWEKLRWGNQGREPLLLEWLDQGVGYRILDTTPDDIDWHDLEQRALNAITAHPGCSQRDVETATSSKGERARTVVRRLLDTGQIADRGSGKKGAARILHASVQQQLDPHDDELVWT